MFRVEDTLAKYAGQIETIWDGVFPELLRVLPEDLARLDPVLDAPPMLRRFEQHWGRAQGGSSAPSRIRA